MNNYLLIDTTDDVIPLTRIIAEDEVDALCKAIKGLVKDEVFVVKDICNDLGIDLREISDIVTYE